MGQGNITALNAEKPEIGSLSRKNDSQDAEPWKLPLLSKLERISKICCVGAGYVGKNTLAAHPRLVLWERHMMDFTIMPFQELTCRFI